MEFEPIYSFSIRKFSYDARNRQLLVHYYDGRRKVCPDIPPIVAAVLRGSSRPEAVLQKYARAPWVDAD
ncbi:MAG TPA: hypothetical protein VGC55_10865 [Dokdonella sp.]